MRDLLRWAVVALLVLTGVTNVARAEKRVALVIGNSAYEHVSRLNNSRNDASALAAKFREIGFDKVTLKLDLDTTSLRRTLGQFSRDAAGADTAVIYFAGHGIEVDGTNYIIPTDAKLSHVADVDFEAIELRKLMRSLNRAKKLKLVILDACRNNPFKNNMAGIGGTRSVGRGLARVSPAGSDTLVAYAAREGTVAADGDGEHSPYTQALLKHITAPGLDVRLLFGRVRDEVLASTDHRQEPFTYGSLGGNVLPLNTQSENAHLASAEPSPLNAEALSWNSVKDSNTAAAVREHLKRFPTGSFADLARIKLSELNSIASLSSASPSVSEESAKLNACDWLAAHPDDNQRKFLAGVQLSALESHVEDAIRACRSAASSKPSVARFSFQLGRALHAAKNYNEARLQYIKAANSGHSQAIYEVGYMHENGLGGAKNMTEAARWFHQAANQGHAQAQAHLGLMYYGASGVQQSFEKAVYWFRKAAHQNNAWAQHLLAIAYSGGLGVATDYKQAVAWHRKAANQGYAPAQSSLASMYELGQGVKKNAKEAAYWRRKAQRN